MSDGGRLRTRGGGRSGRTIPQHLSTQGHTLAMLNIHIRAHKIRAATDERPLTAGTRAQNAGTGDEPDQAEGDHLETATGGYVE